MERINEQYIDDILSIIYDDEKILTKVLISLIDKKSNYSVVNIISQVKWIPQEVIAHIFKTLNIDVFNLLIKEIKESLYDTWIIDETEETAVGKKIIEILESKRVHTLSLTEASAYERMISFVKDNYIEAKCKCGNDLLDPDGEGIYTDVNLPFVFNKYTQCFEEVVEEYTEISGRYRCGHCDRDVTDLIRHII